MKNKIKNIREAVAIVKDGDTIMVGGFLQCGNSRGPNTTSTSHGLGQARPFPCGSMGSLCPAISFRSLIHAVGRKMWMSGWGTRVNKQ